MVDKAKRNIKCLDTSIDIAYNSSTFHLSVSFSVLAAIAKYASIAAKQVYTSQPKVVTQACTSFLSNAILQLH